MDKNYLFLWDMVEKTDPAYTKDFSKGFKGTSINPTYLAKKASEVFGPMGIGWGVDIVKEKYVKGHILNPETGERSIIHKIKITLWYIFDGTKGSVTHFGQTTFVGSNKNGTYTDEDAAKKSLTDATTKALSMLGFGADIFMGMYDDEEYRQEVINQSLMEKADDKDAEKVRQHEEYLNWFDKHLQLIESAKTLHELKTLYALGARKMNRHKDKNGLIILEQAKELATKTLTKKDSNNDITA